MAPALWLNVLSRASRAVALQHNNRFYVYLKPQHADDAAIKRLSNFPGLPPVFILVLPH